MTKKEVVAQPNAVEATNKKFVTEVREFTSGVTWRVEVYSDGTTGRPVPGKMWTTEPKTIKQRKKERQAQKPKKLTDAVETTREETIEL